MTQCLHIKMKRMIWWGNFHDAPHSSIYMLNDAPSYAPSTPPNIREWWWAPVKPYSVFFRQHWRASLARNHQRNYSLMTHSSTVKHTPNIVWLMSSAFAGSKSTCSARGEHSILGKTCVWPNARSHSRWVDANAEQRNRLWMYAHGTHTYTYIHDCFGAFALCCCPTLRSSSAGRIYMTTSSCNSQQWLMWRWIKSTRNWFVCGSVNWVFCVLFCFSERLVSLELHLRNILHK